VDESGDEILNSSFEKRKINLTKIEVLKMKAPANAPAISGLTDNICDCTEK
jgi:hypothetical protein